MIKRKYNEKTDVWSCGIMLYLLLCGNPPFKGRDMKEILVEISYNKLEFREPEWSRVSDNAIMFIRELLNFDESKRISSLEAFNHPWI